MGSVNKMNYSDFASRAESIIFQHYSMRSHEGSGMSKSFIELESQMKKYITIGMMAEAMVTQAQEDSVSYEEE